MSIVRGSARGGCNADENDLPRNNLFQGDCLGIGFWNLVNQSEQIREPFMEETLPATNPAIKPAKPRISLHFDGI
jgi:hypothetical protein